jgi:hypothetical protein
MSRDREVPHRLNKRLAVKRERMLRVGQPGNYLELAKQYLAHQRAQVRQSRFRMVRYLNM